MVIQVLLLAGELFVRMELLPNIDIDNFVKMYYYYTR